MENINAGFTEFLMSCGVLSFGDFVLKSGRRSPYFINTGKFVTGSQLARLGSFYAARIIEAAGKDAICDGSGRWLLFGPAYKGIPLAAAAASALWNEYGADVRYCFNRKEAKDHGEGGIFVGSVPRDGDRVIIIEDVVTAGTALREVLPLLVGAAKVEIPYMIISADRCERTVTNLSAARQIEAEFGIKVCPITTVRQIRDYVKEKLEAPLLEKMDEYIKEYCV